MLVHVHKCDLTLKYNFSLLNFEKMELLLSHTTSSPVQSFILRFKIYWAHCSILAVFLCVLCVCIVVVHV